MPFPCCHFEYLHCCPKKKINRKPLYYLYLGGFFFHISLTTVLCRQDNHKILSTTNVVGVLFNKCYEINYSVGTLNYLHILTVVQFSTTNKQLNHVNVINVI